MTDQTEVSMPKPPGAPQDNRRKWIIIAIVAVLVICFCCVLPLALYFGYDYLGDPLHIYGALPRLLVALMA